MFREVENIFQRDEWFRWRYQIRLQAGKCEHWLRQGDLDKAEKYARRLLESASHYEARKYVAIAHKLLAEVALARGDSATAETELDHALDQLQTHPVPIVAWKAYALLGRLYTQAGNPEIAGEAFAQAAVNIERIAGGVRDDELRATFLNSSHVREVFEGVGMDKACV
jgi:tetratricopeptide (TPR) repeat protein